MRAFFASIRAAFQPRTLLQWVKKNIQLLGVLFFLAVACFLVMLPRLKATQFGLLDDGVTVKLAQVLAKDPIKAFTFMKDSGRFLPSYWFSQILIYQWAGLSSLRWFYVNLLLLVLDTLAVFWIVRFREPHSSNLPWQVFSFVFHPRLLSPFTPFLNPT
jgi:hypothetical protein